MSEKTFLCGVYAQNSPACIHLDTDTNASVLVLDCSIVAGRFSIGVAKKQRL